MPKSILTKPISLRLFGPKRDSTSSERIETRIIGYKKDFRGRYTVPVIRRYKIVETKLDNNY